MKHLFLRGAETLWLGKNKKGVTMKKITLKLNRTSFQTLILLYETSDFIYTDYDSVKIIQDVAVDLSL